MRRLAQHAFVLRQQIVQHAKGLIDVVLVVDADDEVEPARRQPRIVLDRGGSQLCVRYRHVNTVEGVQFGGEQADLHHRSGGAPSLDVLADPDRSQEQQQGAGGDVGQRALQGETDGETRRAQHRDDAGGLHAEPGQDSDQHQHDDGVAYEAGDEGPQRGVDALGALERVANVALCPGGRRPADDQQHQRAHYVQCVLGDEMPEGFHDPDQFGFHAFLLVW